MTLNDLNPGQIGYVVKVRGSGAFRKRVIEMGFTPGRRIEVVRKAPLQDPVEYRLMDYEISLRRSESRSIEVVTEEMLQFEESEMNSAGTTSSNLAYEVLERKAILRSKEIDVAIVGNPNCGKTTLFNFASGSTEHVGNYSGVTVEAKTGSFRFRDYKINLIDLPGTYSLSAYSPEELFVRKQLISSPPDFIINVIDASNLERNLFLTTQLMELDIPVVIALNMHDELLAKGDYFDYKSLGEMLGIPFQPTVGHRNKGVHELLSKVVELYENQSLHVRKAEIRFVMEIENAIERISEQMCESHFLKEMVSSRFYAIKLLENDREALAAASRKDFEKVHDVARKESETISAIYHSDTESLIADARYGFIAGALKETYRSGVRKDSFSSATQRIDRILTHRFLGFPIFLFFIWLMFFSTFFVGSFPMHWMELGVGWIGEQIAAVMHDGWFKDLMVDGIIGGVGGVLVFLPNILILFLFIAIMEDTGYMARIAFLMDKVMHRIGLHGKSFIPMIMGFGCNVPAIMATRTLENPTDRLLTILINPFMSCSARLPVYILVIGALFPQNAVWMLFLVYAIGVLFAVLFSLFFKKTIFRKTEAPFVMELPPYRMPTHHAILRHMWFRASQYLKKMGGIILIASVLIWALGYFPRKNEPSPQLSEKLALIEAQMQKNRETEVVWPGEKDSVALAGEHQLVLQQIESERQENSYIGRIGKFIQPVMEPLGFDWRLSVSLVAGVAAKEVVVSTMSVLFSNEHNDKGGRISAIKHPAGKTLGEQLVSDAGGKPVLNPVTGFAFLMFVLLYFPCVAVVAAIRKETGGWKWALFTVVYTTAVAWFVAFGVVKIGGLLF
ncbi:MAG TPA: ferrous iron transport protein B [Bacteroidales bacterium]|nr:ferrous iron transport protein B [Bacteroidales bacterium]